MSDPKPEPSGVDRLLAMMFGRKPESAPTPTLRPGYRRLRVDVPPEVAAAMTATKNRTGAESVGEVVRRSFATYDALTKRGRRIRVVGDDGQIEEVTLW